MKMQKVRWMAALVAGALITLSPGVRAEDQPAHPPKGQRSEMAKERFNKMAEELQLTEAQKPKVEALMKTQAEKMRGLKDATPEERKEKMQAGRAEMEKQMKTILTPEQYTKWEKLRKERGAGRRGAPGGSGAEKPDKN